MPTLPDFRLETYFSTWEFAAKYHMTASDAQTIAMASLIESADDDLRELWDGLELGYTETFGRPALREAIAQTYDELEGANILCFGGAEEGLYLAMQVLLDPGDHAIVITPNYQAAETVPLSICDVTGVALHADDNWRLDLDEVRSAVRPNTKLISVNFPNNPTGSIPDEQTWSALGAFCEEAGIWLFSDEVYRGLEVGDNLPLRQAADLCSKGLSLNVMSKAYGLPGLRIGWIATQDQEVLGRLERAKHYTTICNSAPSEVLALMALRVRDALLERNRGIIERNLPVFDGFFERYPDLFEWQRPQGGCVCFPRYLGDDGVEAMCAELVTSEGVLLLPASIYESSLTETPRDRFRIGVGRSAPDEGLERWAAWIDGRR